MDSASVFRFLDDRQSRGEQTVLVTVCAVEGSSMRNPGTVMGVAEDGSFAGSLSGGCIENAVVAEALDAMKADASRVVRYGAGSPYLDIKLPCGGGLDLHFQPLRGSDLAASCLGSIRSREPFSIRLSEQGAQHIQGWSAPSFEPDSAASIGVFGHWPVPKLEIVGHGAGVEALARLGQTFGCSTRVLTPDQSIIASLEQQGIVGGDLIERSNQIGLLQSDPWTAIVFLFHDHDWEIDLIERALQMPYFYLGAMGGRKAHAMRREALSARGVSEQQLNMVRAPIGVFHSSRDPQTLALSTLAEIIRSYQEIDFEASLG